MPSTTDRFRRHMLLQALTGAGLLGGAGISGLIGQALADGIAPAAQGIRRVKGSVRVNGSAAVEGTPIRSGDTVVTAANSQVIYVIGQDAFMQRGQSRVSFGDSAAAGVFRVISGKLLSVFGQGQKHIQTPTATIGIRGTGCYIEAGKDRVYFCLCYGEADLVPRAAPAERETIRTTYHDHPLYIHGDRNMPKMMVSAPVINHTDAELVLLESLVGRRPPFDGAGSY